MSPIMKIPPSKHRTPHPLYIRLKRDAGDEGLKRHFLDWVSGSGNHRDVKELTLLAAIAKAIDTGDVASITRLVAARAYFIYYKVHRDARASFYEALAEGRPEADVVDDPWDRMANKVAKMKEQTAELS